MQVRLLGKAVAQSDSLEYRPNERATLAVCTVQSYACCRGLHLWARDLPTVIVVTENLSSNERVRIATDDPVARDHIVRLHANARTESISCFSLLPARFRGFCSEPVDPFLRCADRALR
jgi:hypothetical protein